MLDMETAAQNDLSGVFPGGRALLLGSWADIGGGQGISVKILVTIRRR